MTDSEDKMNLKRRKKDKDGNYRFTFGFTPEVTKLLYEIADADRRSNVGELSYLVVERARALGLDVPGHVGKEGGN